MIYKIAVKTVLGIPLVFHVKKYAISQGFVCFFDEKHKKNKKFYCANCEIEEVADLNGDEVVK